MPPDFKLFSLSCFRPNQFTFLKHSMKARNLVTRLSEILESLFKIKNSNSNFLRNQDRRLVQDLHLVQDLKLLALNGVGDSTINMTLATMTSNTSLQVRWGSEYQTSLVFKCLKEVQMCGCGWAVKWPFYVICSAYKTQS